MPVNLSTEILNVVAVVTDGAGTVKETTAKHTADSGNCTFFLDTTALTGSSLVINADVVAVVNGVDRIIASFALIDSSGAQKQTLKVTQCPAEIKIVYAVGGTVPVWTANVWAMPF